MIRVRRSGAPPRREPHNIRDDTKKFVAALEKSEVKKWIHMYFETPEEARKMCTRLRTGILKDQNRENTVEIEQHGNVVYLVRHDELWKEVTE